MQFGICTPIENADLVKIAGGDFIEEHVRNFLQGEVPDGQWHGLERMKGKSLPIPVANSLVPPHLKIVGPAVDFAGLKKYMRVIFTRTKMTGMKVLVFGSPAARWVPEGFDRGRAKEQILDFIRMSVELAAEFDILLVAEPVNQIEANIMLTVGESMDYVRAINHPHFQCMVDSWHMWRENEPLEQVRAAAKYLRHVHLADWKDRRARGSRWWRGSSRIMCRCSGF